VFRKLAFVKFALVKSVLVKTTPDISTPDKSAPARLTPAPIKYPPVEPPPVLRTIYPVFNVAVAAPVIPPLRTPVSVVFVKIVPEIPAFVSIAPVKLAPVIVAPVSATPDKSNPARFAFSSHAYGPIINPPRATYPAGNVAVAAPTIPPPVIAFVRLVFVRLAPVIVDEVRTAFVKFAFVKSIPVIFTDVNIIADNAAPVAFTPAPMIYPFRATYPVGSVVVVRPVIPPDDIRVNIVEAPLIFVFVIIVPVRDTPDKSTFVSDALARDTLGPTIYPARMTYPVGSVAVVAFTSPPVIIRVNVAPVRFAFVMMALVIIVSVKSILERLAVTSETPVPIIYPPRTTYPVGIVSVVDEPPVIPPLITPVNVTRERFAPDMSHDVRVAFVNTLPDKSAPVNGTPVISTAVNAPPRIYT
jgi:hypothetical protein